MEDEFINEDEDFLNKANQESVVQKVCQNIDSNNGVIKELKNRQASVMLETTSKMILDKRHKMIYVFCIGFPLSSQP